MRFVIGAVALLVLGSIFGSLAGLIFWPDLSYATGSITLCENGIICSCIPIATIDAWAKGCRIDLRDLGLSDFLEPFPGMGQQTRFRDGMARIHPPAAQDWLGLSHLRQQFSARAR